MRTFSPPHGHTRRSADYDLSDPTKVAKLRSKQAFKTWFSERPKTWREAIEVVAMDGFTGFKTAAAEELPEAVAVMDPFHVVRLAGDAFDRCRRRSSR